MNETQLGVTGNVATPPVYRETPSGPVTRFRLAVTPRHRDPAKDTWVDGHTNFFTVWARRSLATHAAASLTLGDPVMVQGRLKIRAEERGGQLWTSADIEAGAIGHDLTRGTAAFRRSKAGGHQPVPATATAVVPARSTPAQRPAAGPEFTSGAGPGALQSQGV